MSRYPSEDVARFDQQFRETDAERHARWKRARSLADASKQVEASLDRAQTRSSAFQEGADTAILHQAPVNPYRRAMRALTDPESLATLGKLAQGWEDGYVSNRK